MEVEDKLQKYTVERDDMPPLRFKGKELGYARSTNDPERGNWSGSWYAWQELTLFSTQSGKYVVERVNYEYNSQQDVFLPAREGKVLDGVHEVIEFFGHGNVAKALYEEAGIDAAVEID